MSLIAFVFPRLRTAKDVVRKMVKKPRFRTPFDSQHTKGCQNLLKSGRQHFYHFLPLPWGKWSWKNLVLQLFETSGLYVSTLIADDKYYLRKSRNSPQPIQIQLSNKQKVLSEVFAPFLKSTSYFEQFQRKITVIVDTFLKLLTAKEMVRKMYKKPCLGTPFDSQHEKGLRRLLKSARRCFYHIFSWV